MSYQEYNRYQEYSTDYDDNKYINLGLSIKSQELVTHLYHSFDENDSYREKFEDILYSVLEDIQKYKNENERLELAHKKYISTLNATERKFSLVIFICVFLK